MSAPTIPCVTVSMVIEAVLLDAEVTQKCSLRLNPYPEVCRLRCLVAREKCTTDRELKNPLCLALRGANRDCERFGSFRCG